MSNILKFRVRDRRTKKVIGYECLMPDISNDAFMWAKSTKGVDWESGVYEGEYYIREQYIGLKDKTTKDIYKGDIVKHVVDMSQHGGNYGEHIETTEVYTEEGRTYPFEETGYCMDEYEIVGDVWENHELLTQ